MANNLPRYLPGFPPPAAMLRNNSGGAAANTNPAAPWMNPMNVNANVNAMNAVAMNQLQQQHQPQDVFTQQHMANLVNNSINPLALTAQQHHQKLQMMQLHQRMEQQRGRGGDLNVIEHSLQQQHQQQAQQLSPPPQQNLMQQQDRPSQQLMQYQLQQRE